IPLHLDLDVEKAPTIQAGSEEEKEFLTLIKEGVQMMGPPGEKDSVPSVVRSFTAIVAEAWSRKAKAPRVCKRSKTWWNADCAHAKRIERKVNTPENLLALKKATKRAKRAFFESKISEIADKTKRPWDLMHWTGPRKLPPSEAIRFEGEPCDHPDKLWNALHNTFNSAEGRSHDVDRFRDSMPVRDERPWGPSSMAERTEAVAPGSGRSAPGLDHLTWSLLKLLMKHEETAEL